MRLSGLMNLRDIKNRDNTFNDRYMIEGSFT